MSKQQSRMSNDLILKGVLSGAGFKEVAEVCGISSARVRTIVHNLSNRYAPEIYKAGNNIYGQPSIGYLQSHGKDILEKCREYLSGQQVSLSDHENYLELSKRVEYLEGIIARLVDGLGANK